MCACSCVFVRCHSLCLLWNLPTMRVKLASLCAALTQQGGMSHFQAAAKHYEAMGCVKRWWPAQCLVCTLNDLISIPSRASSGWTIFYIGSLNKTQSIYNLMLQNFPHDTAWDVSKSTLGPKMQLCALVHEGDRLSIHSLWSTLNTFLCSS